MPRRLKYYTEYNHALYTALLTEAETQEVGGVIYHPATSMAGARSFIRDFNAFRLSLSNEKANESADDREIRCEFGNIASHILVYTEQLGPSWRVCFEKQPQDTEWIRRKWEEDVRRIEADMRKSAEAPEQLEEHTSLSSGGFSSIRQQDDEFDENVIGASRT